MMKKTLVALAAAAVAGGAFAQSSVTISGVVDINYGQVDGSGGTTATTQQGANSFDQQRVAQNGSATSSITFSGSEDIGGGLRAIFRYEMNPDFVGGTPLGVHQSFLGLTGNFGEIRMGRVNSAFLANWGIVSQFGTNLGSGFGGAGVLTRYTGGTAPTRFNGAIEYQTPVFNGIQGRLMYVPEDTDVGATNRTGVVDAGLRFAQGPISAMFSWQQTKASRSFTVASSAVGLPATTTGTDLDTTLWMLGARYTMGALVFSGGYWQEKVEISGVERADITGWSLGARYTMGPWALIAMYTQSEDDAATGLRVFDAAGSATALETGANRSVLGLGVDYMFSKRTALYGRFEGRDMGPTEVQTIAVGIRHTF